MVQPRIDYAAAKRLEERRAQFKNTLLQKDAQKMAWVTEAPVATDTAFPEYREREGGEEEKNDGKKNVLSCIYSAYGQNS